MGLLEEILVGILKDFFEIFGIIDEHSECSDEGVHVTDRFAYIVHTIHRGLEWSVHVFAVGRAFSLCMEIKNGLFV